MIEELKNDRVIKADHYLNQMNATCAWYPILIYMFGKFAQAQNIVEIGSAEGYGSYYLAQIAKDHGGMYYGIDFNPGLIERVDKLLTEADLPHTMICADTKEMTSFDFTDRIDIAFVDGEHTTEAVMHEIELLYPKMNKRGYGWIFCHDIVDMGVAGAWLQLTKDKRFESVGTNHNYGLGILRCVEGMESYESIAERFEVKHL
jgi:23S rRNA U2552 (ribose-2'-O)-methylase RlmE/FtsJ